MKNVQKIDLGLTGYDELFANDEERKVNKLPRIFDIPISEIDDFPDHPFKVKIDEDMDQLVQSIKERGIITPVTLRPKEDGRYEIVSGHRRKKACELAGLDTVKAEVREMSRDEAIILMVESNLQRSTILPSEKAFSYKMRLEAMKRQAGRPAQDNYSPVGNNSLGTKSSEIMADEVGESRNTIFRYIRLTELIPPLLDLVDEGRIAFRPAVELSYREEIEIAVHADIEDEGQSVKVYVPEIKTTASIDGKKEITTAGKVTVEDVVSYTNLIPGTEYTIRGTLMNKATGEVFTVNGETITAEVKFTPKDRNGEVKVKFVFDASGITKSTSLVVFESLYRDDVEITTHKDIEDKDQTVTITPPPDIPKTGDTTNIPLWGALTGISLLGAGVVAFFTFRKKKEENGHERYCPHSQGTKNLSVYQR